MASANERYTEAPQPIDPGTCIGHVHLKVADLERALDFYCGVLGFQITQRYGRQAAFVSAGGYHHIGLNTWQSKNGSPPAPAQPVCITWRFSTQPERHSPTPFAA